MAVAVEGVDMVAVLLGGRGARPLLLSPGERDERRWYAHG